jgi:23S rRNA (guanosine2251-2'-O)-methyltransferase
MKGRMKIHELWIVQGKKSARRDEILGMAKDKHIPVRFKTREELSRILPGTSHQGIVALAEEFIYSDLDHLINIFTKSKGKVYALLIAADHITDEGNLGSLIRTAAFFGSHGLIIPKDRSARVTPKVIKRSSGAYVYLPVARVVNLGRALDLLRRREFWIVGAAGGSPESIYQFDWNRDLVLVLGNEQKGLSPAARKRCHHFVGIPTSGYGESLNVSVAAGVILSEIVRQRKKPER